MRRLVYCFVFALLMSTIPSGQADAGVEWCSEDPVFIVNGNIVDVTTSFPAQYVNSITGPVVFELHVPQNAIAAVVTISGRVPLQGKVVKSLPRWWGLLGLPVVVRVTLNATQSFETVTRVTGTGLFLTTTVKGKSNQVTVANYKLLLP
ncbi:MAG TPA: hypothetical protein VJ726_00910 [Candidatus Limnocylindria bacterium]|nr:hypothetical protein [Candidatus Limnocylindria bacterium]